MQTSKKGIDIIKQFESCKLNAYHLKGEKYWTIGWGHNGPDVTEGMVISQSKADDFLKKDLAKFEKYVNSYMPGINQNQFDALVSFTYNCGPGNLKKLIAGRSLSEIADAMLKYNHANGVEHPGLTKRRKTERELFIQGDKQMSVKIAHASIDENNHAKGGSAGDQTGKEVCIRDWYNKPWDYVIRFQDPVMRDKVAYLMEKAARNDHIGYDQNQRNTLLIEARKYGYDVGNITKDVECDCSSLVAVACMYAGVPESKLYRSNNCVTTRTLLGALTEENRTHPDVCKVLVYKNADLTQKSDKLLRGDILLSVGHHVAVVIGDSTKVKSSQVKSVSEIAREVLSGKWGNGQERKDRLTSAGYNYEDVRKEVNRLIHG